MRGRAVALVLVALLVGAEAINVANNAELARLANNPAMELATTLIDKLGEKGDKHDVGRGLVQLGTSPSVQMALDWLDAQQPSASMEEATGLQAVAKALGKAADHVKDSCLRIASQPNIAKAFVTSRLGSEVLTAITALDTHLALPRQPLTVPPAWASTVAASSPHHEPWQQMLQQLAPVSALEVEGDDDISETITFVDSVFGGSGYTNYHQLIVGVSVVLIGVAITTAGVLVAAVASFIFGLLIPSEEEHAKSHKSPVISVAMSLTWLAVSVFLVATSGLLLGWNRLTMHIGDQLSIENEASKDVFTVLNSGSFVGLSSELAVQVALEVVHGATFDTGSKGLVADPGINYPSFCEVAWNTDQPSFNRYPTTSDVYKYNMRRVADHDTSDNPDLDYVKTLLNLPNYPPRAGGMTSEQAHMFSALSNECEAYHGDITQCCAAENCGHMNSKLCMLNRCPGQELRARGSSHACSCLEVQTHLGLVVEHSQVSLCAAYVRDAVRDRLASALGLSDLNELARKAGSYIVGCRGVYSVNEASFAASLEMKDYSAHTFTDSGLYGGQFLSPTTGASGETSVTWSLTACSGGAHELEFRVAGRGTSGSFQVFVNDLSGPFVTYAAGDGTVMELVTASVSLEEGNARVRVVFPDAATMPYVHMLTVKN